MVSWYWIVVTGVVTFVGSSILYLRSNVLESERAVLRGVYSRANAAEKTVLQKIAEFKGMF